MVVPRSAFRRLSDQPGWRSLPWRRILNRAQADGWAADFLSSANNPATRAANTREDGGDLFWEAIPDALGTLPNLVQETAANQPKHIAGGFGQLDAAENDGTRHMTTGVFSLISQPYTIVVLGKLAAAGEELRRLIRGSLNGTASSGPVIAQQSDDGGVWNYFAGSHVNDGPSDADPHLFVALFNGSNSQLRIDGAVVAEGNPGTRGTVSLDWMASQVGTSGHEWVGLGGAPLLRTDVDLGPIQAMEDLILSLADIPKAA